MTDAAAAFFAEYQRQLARADDLQTEDEKRRAQKRRLDLADLNSKRMTTEPLRYRTTTSMPAPQQPARLTPEQSREWNAWAQETMDHYTRTFLTPMIGEVLAHERGAMREHVERELAKTRTEIEVRLGAIESRLSRLEAIVDEGRVRDFEDRLLRFETRLSVLMDSAVKPLMKRVG
jgi:hypothetical protein